MYMYRVHGWLSGNMRLLALHFCDPGSILDQGIHVHVGKIIDILTVKTIFFHKKQVKNNYAKICAMVSY